MNNIKYPFVVMVCYYGMELRAHRECIDAVKAAGVPFLPVYDCPYLDIARSHAVTQALKQCPEAEGVMFIDHDIHGFDANDVIGFCQRALLKKADVVVGAYSLRRPGFMVTVQPLDDKPVEFYVPGYRKAKYGGTGWMFISRKALEALDVGTHYVSCVRQDVTMYFAPYVKDGAYHPDDVGFCYRVRDNGGTVWIDQQIRILHRGAYDYALEDAGLSVPNYAKLTMNFDPAPVPNGVSDVRQPDTERALGGSQ